MRSVYVNLLLALIIYVQNVLLVASTPAPIARPVPVQPVRVGVTPSQAQNTTAVVQPSSQSAVPQVNTPSVAVPQAQTAKPLAPSSAQGAQVPAQATPQLSAVAQPVSVNPATAPAAQTTVIVQPAPIIAPQPVQAAPAPAQETPQSPTVTQPVTITPVPVAQPPVVQPAPTDASAAAMPPGQAAPAPIQAPVVVQPVTVTPAPAAQSPAVTQPAPTDSQAQVTPSPAQAATAPTQGGTPQVEALQPDTGEGEIKGIDTVDLEEPQGNWLFKRMWWQRAQTQYEKIKAAIDTVMDSRIAFFDKRTDLDKHVFDPFYMDIGIGRGVLEELIDNVLSQIDQERTKQGELSLEEREFLAKLTAQKADLEQLKSDVQKINTIDVAVDDAITMLIKQINAARNFEKKAWQDFKSIAQELNDKKARELYYGMTTYWQNINDIASYIQGPFSQYFDALGSSAHDQIQKVTDMTSSLKEKGIDFKKHWQELQDKLLKSQEEKEYESGVAAARKKAEEQMKIQKEEEQARQKLEQANFFEKLWNSIRDFFAMAWNKTIGALI